MPEAFKMTLAPLLAAGPLIQLHVAAALASAALLLPIGLLTKGTAAHRLIGWIWVMAMAATALSSFGITRGSTYSLIHLLSVISLASLTAGVLARRHGNIASHRGFMIGAAAGLVGAGLFTILPGRIMNAVIFG